MAAVDHMGWRSGGVPLSLADRETVRTHVLRVEDTLDEERGPLGEVCFPLVRAYRTARGRDQPRIAPSFVHPRGGPGVDEETCTSHPGCFRGTPLQPVAAIDAVS